MIHPQGFEIRLKRKGRYYEERATYYDNTRIPIAGITTVFRDTHTHHDEGFVLEVGLPGRFSFYYANALRVTVEVKQNGKDRKTFESFFSVGKMSSNQDVKPPKHIKLPGQTRGWSPGTDVERWEATLGKIFVTVTRMVR